MTTISERLREVGTRDEAKAVTVRASDCREAADVIDELVEAFRGQFCPRPCNGRPDDFSVGECFDAGECGCSAASALARAKGERA